VIAIDGAGNESDPSPWRVIIPTEASNVASANAGN
jgi:hypothetical protein